MMNKPGLQLPKWLIAVTAIGVLLLVILYALGVLGADAKIAAGNTPFAGQPVPAQAKLLQLSSQSQAGMQAGMQAWQGTIRSRLAVKMAAKLTARITEVLVHPGDSVNQGQVLARLDDRELQAAYQAAVAAHSAAQAQALQAQAEAGRISDLYNKQAATRQNYDAVLAQAQSAQALAEQAANAARQSRVLLAENVLAAPFAGVVAERWLEPGDMATPNQAIVSLLKPDDLRLEVAVADYCSPQLKLGMVLKVRVDAIQQTVSGTVDEISPQLDPQTRSQLLKLRLPKQAGLQHGQFAWLELACQAQAAQVWIPVSAIMHYGQLQAVKVVNGGYWQVRHIRTGKQAAEQVQVLSGLQAGDTILLDGGLQP